jgi:hypothetical protein
MDSSNHGGVTTEQLLAILGAKEVEIQMLRAQLAQLSQQLANNAEAKNP